jgi:hypothetical protein
MKYVTLNFLFFALLLFVGSVKVKMGEDQVDIKPKDESNGFLEEIEKVLGIVKDFEWEREKKGVLIDDEEWEFSIDPNEDLKNKIIVTDYDEDGDIDEDDVQLHKEYLQELEDIRLEEEEARVEAEEEARLLAEEEAEEAAEEAEEDKKEEKVVIEPTDEEIKLAEEKQEALDAGKNFSLVINNTTYYLTDNAENTPITEIIEIGKAEAKKIIAQFPQLNELKNNISTLTNSLGEYVVNLTNKYEIYNEQNEHEINKINLIILEQLQTQLEAELQTFQKNIQTEQSKIEKFDLELEKYTNKLPQKTSICSILTDCNSCVADPHCGWCASSNQCVEGNEFSSTFGKCSFYNFNKCSKNSNCEYNNCNECLADPGCGWCNNVNPICLKKDEAEAGLCRMNLFYHVWRESNNKCPEINIYNFLDYIDNKLEESKEVVIPDEIVTIDIPRQEDVIKTIDRLNEEKVNSTITIDKFLRGYDSTMKELRDVESEEIKLNVMCGWNDTIQKEGKCLLI